MSFDKIQAPNSPLYHKHYSVGDDVTNFNVYKGERPTFAFDYVNLKLWEYGFCYNVIRTKDYQGLLKGLQRISKMTYEQLKSDPDSHFYDVDFNETNIAYSDFTKYAYDRDRAIRKKHNKQHRKG